MEDLYHANPDSCVHSIAQTTFPEKGRLCAVFFGRGSADPSLGRRPEVEQEDLEAAEIVYPILGMDIFNPNMPICYRSAFPDVVLGVSEKERVIRAVSFGVLHEQRIRLLQTFFFTRGVKIQPFSIAKFVTAEGRPVMHVFSSSRAGSEVTDHKVKDYTPITLSVTGEAIPMNKDLSCSICTQGKDDHTDLCRLLSGASAEQLAEAGKLVLERAEDKSLSADPIKTEHKVALQQSPVRLGQRAYAATVHLVAQELATRDAAATLREGLRILDKIFLLAKTHELAKQVFSKPDFCTDFEWQCVQAAFDEYRDKTHRRGDLWAAYNRAYQFDVQSIRNTIQLAHDVRAAGEMIDLEKLRKDAQYGYVAAQCAEAYLKARDVRGTHRPYLPATRHHRGTEKLVLRLPTPEEMADRLDEEVPF